MVSHTAAQKNKAPEVCLSVSKIESRVTSGANPGLKMGVFWYFEVSISVLKI